jgi:hypothetical protein
MAVAAAAGTQADEVRRDGLIIGAASAGTIFEWYDFYL